MVQVIKTWATTFPDELVAFDRQMKQVRDEQVDNGWSRDRTVRRFGEIPVKLNLLMQKAFGIEWSMDRRLRSWFWQHFIIGKIDRSAILFSPSSSNDF